MNPDSTDEIADDGTAQRDTIQVVQAGLTLPKTKKPQSRKHKVVTPDEASVKAIKVHFS